MSTNSTAKQHPELWSKLIGDTGSTGVLRRAMQHAAYSLTDMVNRPIKVNSLRIETRSISGLMTYANDPEAETVGVYLHTGIDLPGQAILILSLNDAMYLVDWLLEARPGTTTKLDDMEYSALAETGNLILSSFLNAVAEFIDISLHPSPPAVGVDMLATILETGIAPLAAVTDDLLIIETDFVNIESELLIRFWVLPDSSMLTKENL